MKAKYIGEPGTNESKTLPDEFEAYGIVFEKGKFVEIEDPAVAIKLSNNSHFEVEGDDGAEAQRGPGRPRKQD